MAIVQISKIQQRSGNLVDLPQLDNAEFGWAADENRLFIGRTGNNYSDQNIEVLTSYSNISFDQINGSDGGNFNITTALNGQILTYVSSTNTWENYTGNSSQIDNSKLQLGDVANLTMEGGAAGYVLQTDGIGNLSWTPKGTLYTNIIALSNATPIVMTVANSTPYTNGQSITISGVNGVANANVNGLTFYLTLATDFASSGNVKLYTDSGRTANSNGTSLTYTNSPNAIATATLGSSTGGSGTVGGSNTAVQFNDQNILNGNSSFTFDKTTTTLTVASGTISTGTITASATVTSPRLISNVAVGTAPLTVTSTTRVANLNVAYANVSDFGVVTTQTTGTFYPVFVNGSTTANYAHRSNANLSFNAATGALSATLFTGTLSTAAQPNITSTGTLTSLSVTGNISAGNVSATNFTGLASSATVAATANAVAGANVSGQVSNALIAGTVYTNAQPNITSVGTLTSLAVTGNISGANITGNHYGAGNNLSNIQGANVTGTVSSATTAGTVTTAAQPNITSTGSLTFAANGNITMSGGSSQLAGANLLQANYVQATFNTASNSQPNITSVGTLIGLTLANAAIISVGSNTNVGTFTGNFSLSAGSRLNATYADLAEYYEADKLYEAGTVLEFGGQKEVTLAEALTPRVAGVVSTNPAYVMNSTCKGEHIVALALQGRVPCKVRGPIRKGDMLVSAGGGFARPSTIPLMGTVIGKALENFQGEGIIEVAVGRL
jgi:hypothetical protein